jgi:predicted RecB family nuclease
MITTTARRATAAGRFYEVDGELLPSVTNILGAVNKPALVNWAASTERAAVTEAAADLYGDWAARPMRPQLSRAAYLATLTARLGQVKAHQKELAKAGDIGGECHRLIEYTMRTAIGADAGPKPVVCDAAQWAFMAFEDWAKSVALKPVLIEQVVYSKVHGFAGTMDVLARVHGVLTLIDFKTSKALYPEAGLQSVAYQTALVEMGYRAPAALIVRLPKHEADPAFEVREVPPVAELFPVFLAVKQMWAWQAKNDEAYWAKRRSA